MLLIEWRDMIRCVRLNCLSTNGHATDSGWCAENLSFCQTDGKADDPRGCELKRSPWSLASVSSIPWRWPNPPALG